MRTTRILEIAANMFVEVAKEPGELPRSFTVENALPDDAELVSLTLDHYRLVVQCEVSSEKWGDRPRQLDPAFVVHFPEVSA